MDDLFEQFRIEHQGGLNERSKLVLPELLAIGAARLHETSSSNENVRVSLYLLGGRSLKLAGLTPHYNIGGIAPKLGAKEKEETLKETLDLETLLRLEETMHGNSRVQRLFRSFNSVAASEDLGPEEVRRVAEVIKGLFNLAVTRREKGNIFQEYLAVQERLFREISTRKFRLGDYRGFASELQSLVSLNVLPRETGNRKVVAEIVEAIENRRKITSFFNGLIVEAYLKKDNPHQRGKYIHLMSLISGFGNGEDIRKALEPDLPRVGIVYSPDEALRTLSLVEKVLEGERDVGVQFGVY